MEPVKSLWNFREMWHVFSKHHWNITLFLINMLSSVITASACFTSRLRISSGLLSLGSWHLQPKIVYLVPVVDNCQLPSDNRPEEIRTRKTSRCSYYTGHIVYLVPVVDPHPGLQRWRRGGAGRFSDPCVVYTQWWGPTNGSPPPPLIFWSHLFSDVDCDSGGGE